MRLDCGTGRTCELWEQMANLAAIGPRLFTREPRNFPPKRPSDQRTAFSRISKGGALIGRSHEAKPRTYSGVEFDLLVADEESMVTKMKYRAGNRVPTHRHPNVQSGYVLSGRYLVRIDATEQILSAGDSYSIHADVDHSIEVIEPGEVIDVFVPPRHDYL